MALANVLPVLSGVFLLIVTIFSSSWSFAQRGGDSINDLSSDQGISYSRPARAACYTLLAPETRTCLAPDWRVGDISNRASRSPGGIFLSQKASNQERKEPDWLFLWEEGSGKSYLIPAAEIIAFNLALNGVSRLLYPNETQNGKKVYSTNLTTFRDNLDGPWVIDEDSFTVAQLRHPYQGAMYQGFARSAGLGFWESAAYTFIGQFIWNTGGETDPPSYQDQISTGIAGNFLGEPLFRMAGLILEHGSPGFWRDLAAALVLPSAGFNRHAFGNRFKAVFPSYDPAVFWRVRFGATWNVHTSGAGSGEFEENNPLADFSLTYGLPGKPGYQYTRPFDYFEFQLTTSRHADYHVENLLSRGLLFGTEYELGNSYHGIWGLYGSYDYLAPQPFFRVSSTAFSLGTTSQWWVSPSVALQGSVLAGVGYAGGGKIPAVGNRDIHYGVTLQDLISLRLIIGDLAMLEATHRGYYISDLASAAPRGNETIGYLDLGVTVRILGPHALEVQCLLTDRNGHYDAMANQHQSMTRFALLYTLLSDSHFGAVEWRQSH